MGTYAHINGTICCEEHLDADIYEFLNEIAVQNEFWHRNGVEDYFFSFSIKECRLSDLFELMNKWKSIKTLDSALKEWYPIEVYLMIRYESNNERIDCVTIRNGELSHRQTNA